MPPRRTAAGGDAHAGMPGMANMAPPSTQHPWTFIAGYSAAKLGDLATAQNAPCAMLAAPARKAEGGSNPYSGRSVAILEKQVARPRQLRAGQKDEALKLAKEAMDIELALSAPSGPPDPIKPALEFYGELLIEAGRAKEAAAPRAGSCCARPTAPRR